MVFLFPSWEDWIGLDWIYTSWKMDLDRNLNFWVSWIFLFCVIAYYCSGFKIDYWWVVVLCLVLVAKVEGIDNP